MLPLCHMHMLPTQGTKLQKYGRHGNPKTHYFRLSSDDTEVQWESKVRHPACTMRPSFAQHHHHLLAGNLLPLHLNLRVLGERRWVCAAGGCCEGRKTLRVDFSAALFVLARWQGRIRRVPLQWIKSLQKGQRTEVFRRHLQPSLAHVSFSILYVDGCAA